MTQAGKHLRLLLCFMQLRHFILSFFLMLFVVFGVRNGVAQLDTEFWFAAPEVWANHGDQPILLRFSTLEDAANVTVTQPANGTFPAQNLSIAAYGTQTLDLTPWINDIENTPFNTVLPQGLRIESDAPITAYYEINHILNPDIFALKGSSALGTAFYTPFQTYLSNYYPQSKAGIDIVATSDNTEITVTPSVNLAGGYPAGVAFTIELDEGETYALRAEGAAASQHPSGTYITSNQPIAVTISDDSLLGEFYTPGNCQDIIGDQAIPLSTAGTEHIAVKGNLNGPDKVFILGTEENTSLSIDGNFVWTLSAGETYTHTLSNPAAYYETSAPVIALHMTGFGCEVGGAILPPVSCTGSNEVAFVRSSNDFVGMKILVPAGAEGDFTFNGAAGNVAAVNFSAVPGTGNEWMYANITGNAFIPTGGASRLVNSTAKFHLGIINGGATSGTRYGYFSDFANYEHSTFTSDNQLCAGETAELFASPILDATYDWTGPNNFTASGNEIELGPLTVDDAGLYIVTGTAGDCEILPDTLEVFVAPQPPVPDLIFPDALCEGDDWSFTALTSADEWTWSDSEGNLISADSTDSFVNATPDDAGAYSLTVVTESCTSESAEFDLVVYTTEEAPLNDDPIEICDGSSLALSPNATLPNAVWEWTAPDASITEVEELFIAVTDASDAGVYTLGGTSNGCPILSASVQVALSSAAPVALTVPDFLCNDSPTVSVTADDVYSGSWSATCANCLSGSGVLTPESASPGFIDITYISDNPCGQTATVTVEIGTVPDASVPNWTDCEGMGTVQLSGATPGGTWISDCADCCTSNGLFDTGIAGTGTWALTYTISGDCPATGNGQFTVTANTSSAFALSAEACANDDAFTVSADEPGGQWSATCAACIAENGQFSPATAGVGQHTITYVIPGACGTTTDEVITVLALPDPSFIYTPLEGCAPAVVECTASENPGIVDCSWTYAQNGIGASLACDENIFVLQDPGCYTLMHWVTDGAGCTNSSTAPELLCLSAQPSSDFALSPAQPSIFDELLEVWAIDSVATNDYVWEITESGTYQGPSQVLSISELSTDLFNLCLEVTDPVGCSSLTCEAIQLTEGLTAFAPNAFTPDYDGHNDAWRMHVNGAVTRFELRIFDRWGALVFTTNDPEEYWMGEVLGGAHFAADGVYHYEAVLRDDAYQLKTLRGHILLIR